MSVFLSAMRSATSSEWDGIWKECDYSTYFHSREWANIWSVYTQDRMHPDPELVTFSDGRRALLPLSYGRRFKGLVRTCVSSPAGTFGGWISIDELAAEHRRLLAAYLLEKHRNLTWRQNPYDSPVPVPATRATMLDETHALRLQEGFDAIYKKWTKGHASAVHKARRQGVLIKQASSIEDWRAYFRAYEDSIQRWGEKATSRYTWPLFEHMFTLHSDYIRLWLALYSDTVVAGALVFYAKRHVAYWHGAALAQYFHLRPVNLLLYEVIQQACQQGYSWFDFNPSGGHEGVRRFKESFGAIPMACPIITRMSHLTRSLFVVGDKATSMIRRSRKLLP